MVSVWFVLLAYRSLSSSSRYSPFVTSLVSVSYSDASMASNGTPGVSLSLGSAGPSLPPSTDLKTLLKESLVEVLRENPSILQAATEATAPSGELSDVFAPLPAVGCPGSRLARY